MPEIKMERLHLFGVFVLHSKTFITLTYPVFLAELEINHEFALEVHVVYFVISDER